MIACLIKLKTFCVYKKSDGHKQSRARIKAAIKYLKKAIRVGASLGSYAIHSYYEDTISIMEREKVVGWFSRRGFSANWDFTQDNKNKGFVFKIEWR